MKKALLIASILFIAVITTACINNLAVQELNNKANESMQKENYEEAMERLQASLDLDPSFHETYYNLGIAATKAKKYNKAIKAFSDGIKIKEDFPDFYYSLGVVQMDYADELTAKTVYDEEKGETIERVIPEEDQLKADKLRNNAKENFKKYLTMNPKNEERVAILELLKSMEPVENEVVAE